MKWLILACALFTASAGAVDPQLQAVRSSLVAVDNEPINNSSGIIVGPDIVLTANHVVKSRDQVWVYRPGDDTRYKANVVYRDKRYDLAVLKTIAEMPGPYAEVGTASPIPGEKVLAIGQPLKSDMVVMTDGYVSGFASGHHAKRVMHTSVPLSFGNSGGGLFYQNKLVGIAHAVRYTGKGSEKQAVWHLSMFIPIEQVNDALDCVELEINCVTEDINSLTYK